MPTVVGWLRIRFRLPIRVGESPTFSTKRIAKLLHEILEAAAKNTNAPKGSSEQKVGDYYATCMDEAKIEADGIKPLAPEFDRIAKIKDSPDLQDAIAHFHSMGLNVLFNSDSTQDFKNSAEVTV